MKLVFFGTPTPAAYVLEKLAKHHEIVGVVTGEDQIIGRKKTLTESAVSKFAGSLNIPTLKPSTLKNSDEVRTWLQDRSADIFIVVSYGKILPIDIITIPKYKTLNIHYSLLPKYRGASPIQAALLNGDKATGTTIFELEAGLDTGPIYTQDKLEISPEDTYATLEPKLTELSTKSLLSVLENITAVKISSKAQDHTAATYCEIIHKQDGVIDWNKSAEQIYNQWRAYVVWPETYTTYKNQIFKIKKCRVSGEKTSSLTGTVLAGGRIACGEGTILELIEVQPAGKNPMTITAFLNGNKDFIGSRL